MISHQQHHAANVDAAASVAAAAAAVGTTPFPTSSSSTSTSTTSSSSSSSSAGAGASGAAAAAAAAADAKVDNTAWAEVQLQQIGQRIADEVQQIPARTQRLASETARVARDHVVPTLQHGARAAAEHAELAAAQTAVHARVMAAAAAEHAAAAAAAVRHILSPPRPNLSNQLSPGARDAAVAHLVAMVRTTTMEFVLLYIYLHIFA